MMDKLQANVLSNCLKVQYKQKSVGVFFLLYMQSLGLIAASPEDTQNFVE